MVIERIYLKTSHEKSYLSFLNRLCMQHHREQFVTVICEDKMCFWYIFTLAWICLAIFWKKENESPAIYHLHQSKMQSSRGYSSPTFTCLSSIRTLYCCSNIWFGKAKVVKQLDSSGSISAGINDVILEAICFIATCYGNCKRWCLADKNDKEASSQMPKFQTLPPTTESIVENVKRPHFKPCIWWSAMDSDPPNMDLLCMGGEKIVRPECSSQQPTFVLNF